MSDLSLFLSLILVHLLADFFLQPTSWVVARSDRHWRCAALYYHGLVHFGLNLFVLVSWHFLSWPSMSLWSVIAFALMLAISHILIDLIKSYYSGLGYFIADQLLHVLIVVIVWLCLTDIGFDVILQYVKSLLDAQNLLILLAYLLLMKPASLLISLVLAKLVTPKSTSKQGSPAGGHLIGIAERLLILTLILVEQYSAIGLVVAAKSVLRFNDLRDSHDRALTEYILLGSLLSFSITLLVAIALQGAR